jgi:hypothetical protein
MVTFDAVWRRIKAHAGESFAQIQGNEFSYKVEGDQIMLNRTNQHISRIQMEEAFLLVPLKNTTSIQHLRAPSYIFAILTDDRIRRAI